MPATTIITAWDGEKQKKTSEDKFDSHNKNRNEQSAHYGMPPEASWFFSCSDYRITLLLRDINEFFHTYERLTSKDLFVWIPEYI